MIILGVDPGQEHCGIAIVESGVREGILDSGVVWNFIFAPFMVRFLEQYYFDLVVCEGIKSYRVSYNNSIAWTRKILDSLVNTATVIGQLKMACHIHKIPFVTYPKDKVNHAIHGNSKCSKQELQEIVRLRLDLDKPVRPNHCNDAVALSLYAADQWRLNNRCDRAEAGTIPSL